MLCTSVTPSAVGGHNRIAARQGARCLAVSKASDNGVGSPKQQQTMARMLDAPTATLTFNTPQTTLAPSNLADQRTVYWELLSTPESDLLTRARSASDAAVLRRKGHLKEQDKLIDFMIKMCNTHTSEEVMMKVERWIVEHKQDPQRSRLRRLVPSLPNFFHPLRLVDAFREYDAFFALSRRKYVPPNFAELRHIINIAQIHAIAESAKLITFDADGTLYADGAHLEQDDVMIGHIINLMRNNIHVAIVTAAGYPGEAHKFEKRVEGLLKAFRRYNLSPNVLSRFHLMGGECNYLLKVAPSGEGFGLEFVPEDEWRTETMRSWKDEDIQQLLDEAQALLVEGAARLCLPVQMIRKQRAVGIIPAAATLYEVLEELAITVQTQLDFDKVPFCAFNGGNDVFVDVGNKSLGLEALMDYVCCQPHEVMHVGDRFSDTGNDSATRDRCSILWVANPEETGFFIKMLLQDIRSHKSQPYIE